jgi:hypothetical protein
MMTMPHEKQPSLLLFTSLQQLLRTGGDVVATVALHVLLLVCMLPLSLFLLLL